MASYKVAQDVEAEDKLLGPFSFRQFMYLVIAAMAGVVAYGLSRIFMPLVVIPLPITLFFLILALPLRKDQPMEIYLAAIVSYYLKPRQRLWQPDGVQSLIEVTASRSEEQQLTKDITGTEAERRLAYLANLADSQGWSIRNTVAPQPQPTSMVGDVYNEAQNIPDAFADDSGVAQSFDAMIDKADAARRQEMINRMHAPPTPQVVTPNPQPVANHSAAPQADPQLTFNPYPTAIHQRVISPAGDTPQPPVAQPAPEQAAAPTPPPQAQNQPADGVPADTSNPQSTSETPLSPDIIQLANNKDLSVETIAREAHRIEEKSRKHDEQEVVISLR